MLAAIALLGLLIATVATILTFVATRLRDNDAEAVEAVNRLLPQTQCAQCGFAGCRPYAAAIINAAAPINLCPPGGETTIQALARMLDRTAIPLDNAAAAAPSGSKAVIDETACIGCARCLQACPVDAILGAPQRMHTVIADECTGCELCIAPCPVDCISLQIPE